jgi:hypothetical protein
MSKFDTSRFRDRDARMAPFERSAAVFEMVKESTQKEVAEALGISLSHLRNLLRLRARLAPEAWDVFEALGSRASIREWLRICAMGKREQIREARALKAKAAS